MRVAVLFIDGVGIGRHEPAHNPLAAREHLLAHFQEGPPTPLPAGGRLFPVDTTFGIPGRPQSASNQTAILTGEPAPALIGRHARTGGELTRLSVERAVPLGRFLSWTPARTVTQLAAIRTDSEDPT